MHINILKRGLKASIVFSATPVDLDKGSDLHLAFLQLPGSVNPQNMTGRHGREIKAELGKSIFLLSVSCSTDTLLPALNEQGHLLERLQGWIHLAQYGGLLLDSHLS